MNKTISILGCGWLGFPLAEHFIEKGWQVKGSTTSVDKLAQLESAGIIPFLLDISRPDTLDDNFFKSDYLLINIPPSKLFREVKVYLPLIKAIENNKMSKVVFVSSTSVYPSGNQIANEDDTKSVENGENALLDIERAFQNGSFATTVIRFGGLVGGVRYPGRFFSSDKEIKGGNQPVNLIHLDDCIQLIERVLTKEVFGEVFNGVSETHPTRKEFYSLAADLSGKSKLKFNEEDVPFKIISTEKAKRLLGMNYKHSDLLLMLKDDLLWNRT
ncbi:hypothetical protein [Carboxylicivirga sp. RSCT41]|uniref:hypothetical protein n=1 Tax=Carboxylicivirga agarovorans TaxID=3417570 RepID=UPI003D347527